MKPSNVMPSLSSSGSAVSRRRLLKRVMSAGVGVAGLGLMAKDLDAEPTQNQDAQASVARATRGMPTPKIEVRDGFAWVSEKPGWGIEIDEAAAAKMPLPTEADRKQRLRDGSYLPGI